jgi:hypothetical protein
VKTERRIIDLKTLDEVANEAERLHESGYTQVGDWDLCQNLSHCGIFMEKSMDGFDFKLPWILRLIGPLALKSAIKKRTFKPGFKNPPGVDPVPGKGEPEMLNWFQSVVQRVKEHPCDFHPSPLAGYLDPPTWRELHIIHCSHHLGFLIPKI